MVKKCRILSALLIAALLLTGCTVVMPVYESAVAPSAGSPDPTPEQSPAPTSEQKQKPPEPADRIVHAGGDLGEHSVSNSVEAVDSAYAAGCRYIELDFSLTSDGEPVCLHDWNRNYLREYEEEDFPLSLSQFESSMIYGELAPLTLDALAGWLQARDEVYIITDVKGDNLSILGKIALRYPELKERIIPQIYDTVELDAMRAMGYENIIFTLYLLPWEVKTDAGLIAEFARESGLWGIAFPYELAEIDGYVEGLLASGVHLYAHTVNDDELIGQLLEMGISGVYSDVY